VRARVLGLLLLAAVVGVGGGLGIGYLGQPRAASGGTATPMPASSPSVPVDPEPTQEPYSDDIDYPPMPTTFDFERLRMSNSQASWLVPVPKGWDGFDVTTSAPVPRKQWAGFDELRFRPPGEPPEGGYALRVKTVNTRVTPDRMVAQRKLLLADLEDVHYFATNLDSLKFTYRDGNNRLRYNYWRWFAARGDSQATLEMSVVGRAEDQAGLDALLTAFDSTVQSED
jgi:hypothetical protein